MFNFKRHPMISAGLGLVSVLIFIALFARWIAPFDPLPNRCPTGSCRPPSGIGWARTNTGGMSFPG